MRPSALRLVPLEDRYTVHRLAPDATVPGEVAASPWHTITRSPEELSIVCAAHIAVYAQRRETGFVCYRVAGVLDFALVGILARLTQALAEQRISVFAVSSFDTDFVLVRASDQDAAIRAWRQAGIEVADASS